jgi:RNA polymerase sigma factor (sigma-70 family)
MTTSSSPQSYVLEFQPPSITLGTQTASEAKIREREREREKERVEAIAPDVEALKRGSEPEWEIAFRYLWPSVYRAARHPKANLTQEEAEDAASMAMAQLPSRIADVKDANELRALAVTISYCRAISLARKENAIKRSKNASISIEERNERTDGQFELRDEKDDQLGDLEASELLQMLQEGLKALDPTSRSLLLDCYLHHMVYKELSVKYNLTENAVAMRLHWGKQKVREFFRVKRPHLLKELSEYLR